MHNKSPLYLFGLFYFEGGWARNGFQKGAIY